jgi:hypothetical protein
MNSMDVLPSNLQTRLNMIIQTVPLFWDQRRYNHFTNHGPSHSERVHRQKLAQLAQELPEARRLTTDEVFIVSAAAWLYEIGMQSPNLKPVLSFDCQPGDSLSFSQLQEIREKKHLLTERLIIDSVRSDYQGPPLQLGLIRPADDYTRLIAEVCRWCSDEPLEDVPVTLPVNGFDVRVRLLVALLRLADQLYIDRSRVNLDLLQRANLPTKQLARWWAYHYTKTLPIVNGQIRFHYYLPVTQREYCGHIRALIEPDFGFDNNPIIRYLWEGCGTRLMPHRLPTYTLEPAGFKREMGHELTSYLRKEIVPIPTETPREASLEPREGLGGRCLLVLDFENFTLQLAKEGYIFPLEEIGRLLITLLRVTSEQHAGPVDGLAVGHWNRPDLAKATRMVKARVYGLLTVEEHGNSSEELRRELTRRLQSPEAPKRIILVAPREDWAPTVKRFTHGKHLISTWITDLPDADIYRAIVRDFKSLRHLLQLGDPERGSKVRATAQVFLSYAREDRGKVESLYQKLSDAGFNPWMDTKGILPGENWKLAIQKAIQDSDFFLACLSANSVSKRGFVQREIRDALNIWQEKLDSDIYLIPVRLEDCKVTESLSDFQWVNLFEEDGWARLVKAIQVGMERRTELTKLEQYDTLKKPSQTSRVEIALRGDLSGFTLEQQSAMVGALAGILDISREQVRVLEIRSGSVILQIEMPREAVNRLISLYEAGDPIMQAFGIQEVRVIPDTEMAIPEEGPEVVGSAQIKITSHDIGEKPIEILFLSANPSDTTRLKLGEESRAIDQALRQAEFRDKFDIKQHWAVRIADLQGFLLRHKPDIVHFSGHGSESSEIILEDNSGNSQPVSVRALSTLFSVLKDNIRCVVLNACYSEPQAQAIAEHIDCVIGMSEAIGDAAAISFASAFYQALGFGRDLKTAFDLGCVQIDLESLDEQDVPKLLCKKCDPKEIVFVHTD